MGNVLPLRDLAGPWSHNLTIDNGPIERVFSLNQEFNSIKAKMSSRNYHELQSGATSRSGYLPLWIEIKWLSRRTSLKTPLTLSVLAG